MLVLNERAFSKHGQVKGYFNREFIKSEIFPKEFGRLFNTVFEYRQKFDYVDLIIPDEQIIKDYIDQASIFVEKISIYIQEIMSEQEQS